jgi:hypothetical protein
MDGIDEHRHIVRRQRSGDEDLKALLNGTQAAEMIF